MTRHAKQERVTTNLERTLPRKYYVSSDLFSQERERIFFREWFCVGRDEKIPNVGDYRCFDIAGESVIVVRDEAGALRAHYNVCRHRGSRLVTAASPASGCFGRSIRCPYHAWTYELDGSLRTAPFLDEGSGFSKAEFSLYPIGVDTWGGFVFLNLTPSAARTNLREQLGPVPERLRRYPLPDLRSAWRIVYPVAANWKVMLENYNECYHCAGVHPELCTIVPAFKQRGGADLDWDRGIPHRAGAFTFTFSGTTTRAAFDGLDDNERTRHKGELIYPNLLLSLAADHVAAFTVWPHEPASTMIVCDFLFHPAEMSKPDFDPSDAVDFWDLVNRQDWHICESVQRGMSSRMFDVGYYAPMESASLDIRRYIADRLGNIT
jgi:Rieske 2Fe-2S family protein